MGSPAGGLAQIAVSGAVAGVAIWLLYVSGVVTSFDPSNQPVVLWVVIGVALAFLVVGGRRR